MRPPHARESLWEAIAYTSFGLSFLLCAFESVPGWGIFGFGWPSWVYFAIMLVTGILAGVAHGRRYWLPGIFGGALAGVGALYAVSLPLRVLPMINQSLLFLSGAVGCLPGVGLFLLLKAVQRRISEGVERRSKPAERIPESAWPKALRRGPGEGA